MYEYSATVRKVIDGDTVDLTVDLGFHVRIDIRTRLLGINAPEVSTNEGKVSREWMRARLPEATTLTVQTERDPGDKYGRWLAVLKLGDVNINDELVRTGMAVAKVYS